MAANQSCVRDARLEQEHESYCSSATLQRKRGETRFAKSLAREINHDAHAGVRGVEHVRGGRRERRSITSGLDVFTAQIA